MSAGNLVNTDPRPIGVSGLRSGPLAFGCWRFVGMSITDATQRIEAALDAGMNLIDTADVYGFDWGGTGFGQAEELLGSVLTSKPDLRDRMLLATKGGIYPPLPYDSSPGYLRAAVEGSLRRLAVDVIDLYQIHRPDMFAHPEEVAATLSALRDEGKIREVGVSNYTVAQYDALVSYLPFGLATSQPQFSAAHLEPMRSGEFDRLMRDKVTPLAWSPMAGGRLATGEDIRPELVSVLDRLADREGTDRGSVAMAFVLAHPSQPVAIVGTQNLGRIATAADALNVRLDRNDVYDIVEASEGTPLP